MLGAGIVDVLNIVDIADIATGIADIVTDIAGIADRVLRTLRWKQVGAYKVSRGCPVTCTKLLNIRTTLFHTIRLLELMRMARQ